jgi:hypothetical protein
VTGTPDDRAFGSRRAHPRRRAPVTAVAVAVCALTTLALAGPAAPAALAGGESGASSRVVGRGDIVTSIIGWRLGPVATRPSGRPTRCRWVTLTDVQIEWLAALSAGSAGEGGPHPVLDSVRHHLGGDELPDGDLRAQVCAGAAVDLQFVPRASAPVTVEMLKRRMITRLPTPEPVWSPPTGVAVPVHQPVFVSIARQGWRTIENTITVDGITAEVRARPTAVRVISGEPSTTTTHCSGPGRPFDPSSSEPVRVQAAHPDACVISYRTPTAGPSGRSSAPSWIGTVTVLWDAEWRSGAAGSDEGWTPLGTIPRTRLFDRPVRELFTSIETARR